MRGGGDAKRYVCTLWVGFGHGLRLSSFIASPSPPFTDAGFICPPALSVSFFPVQGEGGCQGRGLCRRRRRGACLIPLKEERGGAGAARGGEEGIRDGKILLCLAALLGLFWALARLFSTRNQMNWGGALDCFPPLALSSRSFPPPASIPFLSFLSFLPTSPPPLPLFLARRSGPRGDDWS